MLIASVQNISFGYSHLPALNNISFEVRTGEFVGITGPNGASKSTLLKLLLGLLKPWEGTVWRSKKNIHDQQLTIGYVPQQIASFNAGFPSTVMELVRSGRYKQRKWFKRLDSVDEEMVERALKMVGMWEFRYHKIGSLSGGQKQKICIARVLASEPDLLVLDEPTTGMDAKSRIEFYEFLAHQVKEHERSVILITHNQDEVEPYLTKLLQLERREQEGWRCLILNSCNGLFGQGELLP